MTQIKIEVPAMELDLFAKLIMKGVHSPKDLLDSLVFWGLHFLENTPESMSKNTKANHLKEALAQLGVTLQPLTDFHEVEFNCVIKMFEAEMSHHINK